MLPISRWAGGRRRHRALYVALIVLASTVLLASCGDIGGMQGMHGADEVEGSLDEMSVADFYQANCAGCHGSDRRGGLGPALLPSRLLESDEFYFEVISNGRPGTAMPSWSGAGMADADIESLVEFLRKEP